MYRQRICLSYRKEKTAIGAKAWLKWLKLWGWQKCETITLLFIYSKALF